MTASTVSGAYFSDKTQPRRKTGVTIVTESLTIATTSSDETGDIVKFFPVPHGVTLLRLENTNAALDSGNTLDMDIVLVDDNGTTILYNAGTAFSAAVTTVKVNLLETVVTSVNGGAYVGLRPNPGGSSADEGAVRITLTYSG
jgi:hypothetical protein